MRWFDSLPEKNFLENFVKSVQLIRYSHSGKLRMSSKLSAPGSRKVGKIQKNYLTRGLFSKTRKCILLTLRYSESSRKVRKIFRFQNRINRMHHNRGFARNHLLAHKYLLISPFPKKCGFSPSPSFPKCQNPPCNLLVGSLI